MHKTAQDRSPAPLIHYAAKDEGFLDGITLPSSSSSSSGSRPTHLGVPAAMANRASRPQSRGSASAKDLQFLSNDTQDLAEFLKSSGPDDYRKSLKESSSDELLFSSSSRKKSFRFLRAAPTKWKEAQAKDSQRAKAAQPLPENVIARTTSRGKPYLLINVDYATTCYKGLKEDVAGSSDMSEGLPDSAFGDSIAAGSSITGAESAIASPRPSSLEDRPKFSSTLWNLGEHKVLDADTLETYHQFLTCERQADELGNVTDTNPRLLSLERTRLNNLADHELDLLRASGGKAPQRSETADSTPNDYDASSQNNPKASFLSHRHANSSPTQLSPPPTTTKGTTDSEREVTAQSQRRHSRKAPPRPGPPPTRSLPSLPEDHDAALKLAGRISALTAARGSVVSTTSGSAESAFQPTKDSTPASTDLTKSSPAPIVVPKGRPPRAERSSVPKASMPNGSPTPPQSPSTLLDAQRVIAMPSNLPSPTLSSSRSFASEKEQELEARIRAVEKKNRMLEQALIAVIRGTLGHDQRRPELHRANVLEDLLKELRIVDIG